MKNILNASTIENIKDSNLDKVVEQMLNYDHDFHRGRAAILIGIRINEDYPKYSQLLISEMNKEIHFLGVRLGVKSAWTIAIVLIENLKPADYPKIKKEFDKWDEDEKEGLLDWLKDFPDHCKILKEGKL
jgi:hypothetical protein